MAWQSSSGHPKICCKKAAQGAESKAEECILVWSGAVYRILYQDSRIGIHLVVKGQVKRVNGENQRDVISTCTMPFSLSFFSPDSRSSADSALVRC